MVQVKLIFNMLVDVYKVGVSVIYFYELFDCDFFLGNINFEVNFGLFNFDGMLKFVVMVIYNLMIIFVDDGKGGL